MDTIFPLMFGAVFLLIVGVMILALVRSASEWSSNNSSPVLSVDARVVSKRTNITRHMSQADSSHMTRNSTVYYATFQVESGDRMELRMSGREYGLLAEGACCQMAFDGRRGGGSVSTFRRLVFLTGKAGQEASDVDPM